MSLRSGCDPIDWKTSANDMQTSKYSESLISDSNFKGVATSLQGGRDSLINGSRLPYDPTLVKFIL